MKVVKVGDKFDIGNVSVEVTAIEMWNPWGAKWTPWIYFDWRNRETGEVKEEERSPADQFLADIFKDHSGPQP